MTTDTPRTDAARFEALRGAALRKNCIPLKLGQELEREITEIRNALGDDGRRTHKEFLVLATKASQWREWKEKYIDLRNAHIAEGQDPAGTIWEHADKLQKDLKETKAEVESLRKDLDNWDYGTRAKREQERAEKAESEIKRLKSDKAHLITQCANLLDEVEKLQTLPEKLDIAIEIAKDALWYARIYENEMHFDKIDMLYQKLVEFKK